MVLRRLLIVFCMMFPASMIGQQLFHKVYGTYDYDYGYAVDETYDQGFIVAGTTGSGSGNSQIYLLRTDLNGNFRWQRSIGFPQADQCFGVVALEDSGYVLAGYTNSLGAGGYDGLLVKTDSSGNIEWSKTYGGADWDFLYSIRKTSDNGFIMAGQSFSGGNGNGDAYAVKVDQDGEILWQKWYGGSQEDKFRNVRQTADGGYIFCGWTESFGKGQSDYYVVRTDLNGDTLWTKVLGDSLDDKANDIEENSANEFIVSGGSNSVSLNKKYKGTTVHLSSGGNVLDTDHYGIFDTTLNVIIHSLSLRSSGGLMFAGQISGQAYYKFDHYFGAMFSNAYWMDARTDGSTEDDITYMIKQTSIPDRYVVVGITKGLSAEGVQDVYLATVNNIGLTSTSAIQYYVGVKDEKTFTDASVRYQETGIDLIFPEMTEVKLFNSAGVLFTVTSLSKNGEQFRIDQGTLPAGFYIVKAIGKKDHYTLKFVVE